MAVLLWLLAVVLVLIGLVGVVLPALPGAALVLAGLVVAAAIDGFARIGWPALVVAGALCLLTWLVDWAATALGARRFGASRWGVVGAVLGLLVGLFAGGPIGVVLGPPLGSVALELAAARRTVGEALHSGLGTFIGFVLGTAVKYALVAMMIGVAVLAYLW